MNSDVTDFASLAPAYPEMLLAVGDRYEADIAAARAADAKYR